MIGLAVRIFVVASLLLALLSAAVNIKMTRERVQRTQPAPPSSRATTGASTGPAIEAAKQRSLTDFSNVLDRALFYPDRKVPPETSSILEPTIVVPEIVAAPLEPQPLQPESLALRLLGIAIVEGVKKAFVEQNGKSLGWLSEGEERNGVLLAEIETTHVIVRGGGGVVQLDLHPTSDQLGIIRHD